MTASNLVTAGLRFCIILSKDIDFAHFVLSQLPVMKDKPICVPVVLIASLIARWKSCSNVMYYGI